MFQVTSVSADYSSVVHSHFIGPWLFPFHLNNPWLPWFVSKRVWFNKNSASGWQAWKITGIFIESVFSHSCLCWKCTLSSCRIVGLCAVQLSASGNSPFVWWQNMRCAGLVVMPWDGVFRWPSIASHGSALLAIAVLIKILAVFTALSAIPFACGWYGFVLMEHPLLRKIIEKAGWELRAVVRYNTIWYTMSGKVSFQTLYDSSCWSGFEFVHLKKLLQ